MSYLINDRQTAAIAENIKNGVYPLSVSGLSDSARADFVAAVCEKTSKKPFVIVDSALDARVLKEDLEFYMPQKNVLLYPSKDYLFHNIEAAGKNITTTRINTVMSIKNGDADGVVACIDAVMEYTLDKKLSDKYVITVKQGERFDFEDLKSRLVIMGYKFCDFVEGAGQASFRGGILDVFSPSSKKPIRIEFFDDEVDTVRFFDPQTQLSEKTATDCVIYPCRECIIEDVKPIVKKLEKHSDMAWIAKDVELFENSRYFPAMDRYIPLIFEKIPTIVDYLNDDYIIFTDYPASVFERGDNFANEINENLLQFAQDGNMPFFDKNYLAMPDDILKNTKLPVVMTGSISASCGSVSVKQQFDMGVRNAQSYQGRLELVIDDIKFWQKKGCAVTILAGSNRKREAFAHTLEDNNIPYIIYDGDGFAKKGETVIKCGSVNRGFECPALASVLIGSREIFGTAKQKRKETSMPGVKIKSFADLSIGDYVVHQIHGIGKYLGLVRMEVDKAERDYLKIQYRGTDVLYVPATSLDVVNKYISGEAKDLKLNKMGGSEFAKTKAKVKKALEDIAGSLIALYAARSSQKGFAFSPDNDWQHNFEEMFPYEETPDQLKCIEEVKKDMESERPMERLLCGDVGFGKTEVALRAAFKAVMDSKQVAYLVPTTILAQQHYNTFASRMRDFPAINVEMLSRFRTPKQQKEIVKRVNSGEIDIIIGTHRILQEDLQFKDLGLLIIDEEQRFGVKHKEKIKTLKNSIDVLTLTATPIPRTLHMSLTGIRDMSVIAMPPEDRYPVQTFIAEYDKELIREAIAREVGRGGQVYYVYNRVESIYKVAQEISDLIDGVRVSVAHGQMSERELEIIMMQMLAGEIDVLVCTTIIETGLDIQNANTIIIENADCFGLSQLYQLRGRVGRSNRLAYAYMTYRKNKIINETAEKRLTAIREFTEWGSGFKIAMRDLEIRGAGNLLGARQHGEMDAVGYDMYCKLLGEAVAEAKGEPEKEEIITSVDIKVDTYIPEEYIASHNVRIEIYKKIASVKSEEDKETIIDELVDRFGTPPQSIVSLLDVSLVREYAAQAGISDVTETGERVYMMFQSQPDEEKVAAVVSAFRGQVLYSAGKKQRLVYIGRYSNTQTLLKQLKTVLIYYNSYNVDDKN